MNVGLGDKFGRLTVISGPTSNNWRTYFLCRCECGTEKKINRDNLVGGRTKSCGCLRSETSAAHCKSMAKHGKSAWGGTPEYRAWISMQRRCYDKRNSRYKDYGGRGIKVCKEWRMSFADFLIDMGRKPTRRYSLERQDNDGNYEPSNCVWALPVDQCNNRRGNRFLTVDGETLTVTQWARRMNLSDNIIFKRLAAGYSDEAAIKTPKRGSK